MLFSLPCNKLLQSYGWSKSVGVCTKPHILVGSLLHDGTPLTFLVFPEK